MISVSVIMCTRDPRLSYLKRVLESLRNQSLPRDQWELLIVDNASERPIRGEMNVEWQPRSTIVREERIGLAHARLRGISTSVGELLIFVDDDNVLRPDYVATALEIAKRHRMLGAWSGQVVPEFEIPPPDDLRDLLPLLCLRNLERDVW